MSDDGWIRVLGLEELPDRKPVKVNPEGLSVLVVRDGDRLFAIGDRCTHQGAPLHGGSVRFAGSPATVQCPVHGSVFGLSDGRVLRGPATAPVPAYDVRVNGDAVEIRARD